MSEDPHEETAEERAVREREEEQARELLSERLTQQPLGADVEKRYLAVGRRLLSDDVPTRLDVATRSRMQRIIGVDPNDVDIHVGEFAQEASRAMGARAFTLGGREIFFGRGQFRPDTPEGQALLAHELTHVHESSPAPALAQGGDAAMAGVREGEESAVAAESRALADAVAQEASGAASAAGLTTQDKHQLVDKVVQILRRIQSRSRERGG